MSKKARRNYIRSISSVVERKKMYKAKKQWVVAGMSFLVAMGIGVSADTGVHASTMPANHTQTSVQTNQPIHNTSNIQNQANQLHNKIMANNAVHNLPKSAESNVAKQSPVTSNVSSESASSADSASNKVSSVAPSSTSSKVSASSSVAKPLTKVVSNESNVSSNLVSANTSSRVSNVTSNVSNSTESKLVASSSVSSNAVKPTQSFSASNQVKSVSSVASSTKASKSTLSNSNSLTSMSNKASVSSVNLSSKSKSFNQTNNLGTKGLKAKRRPLMLDEDSDGSDKTGTYDGLQFTYIPNSNELDITGGTANSDLTNFLYNLASSDSDMPDVSDIKTIKFSNSINMSNVTDMSDMLSNGINLQSLDLGNNFDTSKVTNMSDMFKRDNALKSLDLNNDFDTSKVTDMNNMFNGDNNLQTLTINSPKTKFTSNVHLPMMYKETGSDDSSGSPYTLSKPNDFTKSNVGTFIIFGNIKGAKKIPFSDIYGNSDGLSNNVPKPTTVPNLKYLGNNWAFVNDKGIMSNAPIKNTKGNIMVAPLYKGLVYHYNADTRTLDFVSGTANSDLGLFDDSDVGDIPDGTTPPSDILDAVHMNFGNNINTSNVNNVNDMFMNSGNLQTINFGPNFNIPQASYTDNINMFHNNSSLKSITIESSNTIISNTNMPKMYKETGGQNSSGIPYTSALSNDFTQGNVGTFIPIQNPKYPLIYSDIYGNNDGLSNDVPKINTPMTSDWSYVNAQGRMSNTPVLNNKKHVMIAPIYRGMTFNFNKNTNTIEFTDGNIEWQSGGNDGNAPFIGSYYDSDNSDTSDIKPTNIPFSDIKNIKFDKNIDQNISDSDLGYMFAGDTNLQSITGMSDWNMNNVTILSDMFKSDTNLNKSVLTEMKNWRFNQSPSDTSILSNGTSLNSESDGHGKYMLESPVTYLDIYGASDGLSSSVPTSNNIGSDWAYVNAQGVKSNVPVKDAKGNAMIAPSYKGLVYHYNEHNNSVEFTSGVANSNVKYFTWYAPSDISHAKSIKFDNNVDLSHITNMDSMFSSDGDVQSISFGHNINVSHITNLSRMFGFDNKLQYVDLPKFNSGSVTNLSDMFYSDNDLKNINMPDFNTNNITDVINLFGNDYNYDNITINGIKGTNYIQHNWEFMNPNIQVNDMFSTTPNGYESDGTGVLKIFKQPDGKYGFLPKTVTVTVDYMYLNNVVGHTTKTAVANSNGINMESDVYIPNTYNEKVYNLPEKYVINRASYHALSDTIHHVYSQFPTKDTTYYIPVTLNIVSDTIHFTYDGHVVAKREAEGAPMNSDKALETILNDVKSDNNQAVNKDTFSDAFSNNDDGYTLDSNSINKAKELLAGNLNYSGRTITIPVNRMAENMVILSGSGDYSSIIEPQGSTYRITNSSKIMPNGYILANNKNSDSFTVGSDGQFRIIPVTKANANNLVSDRVEFTTSDGDVEGHLNHIKGNRNSIYKILPSELPNGYKFDSDVTHDNNGNALIKLDNGTHIINVVADENNDDYVPIARNKITVHGVIDLHFHSGNETIKDIYLPYNKRITVDMSHPQIHLNNLLSDTNLPVTDPTNYLKRVISQYSSTPSGNVTSQESFDTTKYTYDKNANPLEYTNINIPLNKADIANGYVLNGNPITLNFSKKETMDNVQFQVSDSDVPTNGQIIASDRIKGDNGTTVDISHDMNIPTGYYVKNNGSDDVEIDGGIHIVKIADSVKDVTVNYINQNNQNISSDEFSDAVGNHGNVYSDIQMPKGYQLVNASDNGSNINGANDTNIPYTVGMSDQTINVHVIGDQISIPVNIIPDNSSDGSLIQHSTINTRIGDNITPSSNVQIPAGYHVVHMPKSFKVRPNRLKKNHNYPVNILVVGNPVQATANLHLVYQESNGRVDSTKDVQIPINSEVGSSDVTISPSDYDKFGYSDSNNEWDIKMTNGLTGNINHTFTYNASVAGKITVYYADITPTAQVTNPANSVDGKYPIVGQQVLGSTSDGSDETSVNTLENTDHIQWTAGQHIALDAKGSTARNAYALLIAPDGYHIVTNNDSDEARDTASQKPFDDVNGINHFIIPMQLHLGDMKIVLLGMKPITHHKTSNHEASEIASVTASAVSSADTSIANYYKSSVASSVATSNSAMAKSLASSADESIANSYQNSINDSVAMNNSKVASHDASYADASISNSVAKSVSAKNSNLANNYAQSADKSIANSYSKSVKDSVASLNSSIAKSTATSADNSIAISESKSVASSVSVMDKSIASSYAHSADSKITDSVQDSVAQSTANINTHSIASSVASSANNAPVTVSNINNDTNVNVTDTHIPVTFANEMSDYARPIVKKLHHKVVKKLVHVTKLNQIKNGSKANYRGMIVGREHVAKHYGFHYYVHIYNKIGLGKRVHTIKASRIHVLKKFIIYGKHGKYIRFEVRVGKHDYFVSGKALKHHVIKKHLHKLASHIINQL